MLRSLYLLSVIGLSVVVGVAPLQAQYGPYSTNQNSYWPMKLYDRWIFQTTSPSTKSATVFSVQPNPGAFGCLSPAPTQQASEPWQIDVAKVDPRSYWAVGAAWDLEWMLGVQPASQNPAGYSGALYGFGWWSTDYWSGLQEGTDDVVSTNTAEPAYLLILPNGSTNNGSAWKVGQILYGSSAQTGACLYSPSGGEADSWSVTWSDTSITTPAYSGAALEAEYVEVNSSGTYIEYWYYANNIGPVYINVTSPAAQATTSALVSYPGESGSISQTTPLVTLYDAITAQAGTLGTMTFAEWGPYFAAVTNLAAPTGLDVCQSPFEYDPITLSYYLLMLERIGTSGCTTVQYLPSTMNTTLSQMESLAGTTTGLDYFQWLYYYTRVTGQGGPVPTAVCMPQVNSSSDGLMEPDAAILLDGRQWLLYFEHTQGWPACN